jgi:exopolysaccharide biosynthesis polyprenyl glycosylphosphotransferase
MSAPPSQRERWLAIGLDALVLGTLWTGLVLGRAWLTASGLFDWVPGVGLLQDLDPLPHLRLGLVAVPIWLLLLERNRTRDHLRRIPAEVLLMRIVRATALALLVLLAVLFAARAGGWASRSVVFAWALCTVPAVLAARVLLVRLLRGQPATTRLLVVGHREDLDHLRATAHDLPRLGVEVVGRVPPPHLEGAPGDLGDLGELGGLIRAHRVDQVVLAPSAWDPALLRRCAEVCEACGVTLVMQASFLGPRTGRADLDELAGMSVLTFSARPAEAGALALKRVLDLALGGLLLLLSAPVVLLAALLVKLQDGGPVLFVQERAGLYGRSFPMFKLRSMVPDAEGRAPALLHLNEMDGPVFKLREDPRVTRIGRLLRRTSIDELPQLWNVVRGEMSLVGPRPPLPAEVERYEPWQLRRLSMRPGLTCIWQVSGRNDVDFQTWMRQDLAYIDHWSLGLDLELLARTVPVVLRGDGAR